MSYSCDPKRHDGKKIAADWFIREATEELEYGQAAYAACDDHVLDAIKYVMGDNRSMKLLVRRVTPEVLADPSTDIDYERAKKNHYDKHARHFPIEDCGIKECQQAVMAHERVKS